MRLVEVRIDTAEKEAAGRSPRSLPFGGAFAIVLGGLFLGLGAMFGAAVAIVLAVGADLHEHKWLIPPAVLFLCVAGAGLIRTGIRDQRRAARGKRLAAEHPDERWFADWTWNPAGALAESDWSASAQFISLFVLLIAAPFNVLWLHVFDPAEKPEIRLFSLMVLIPDFFMYLVGRGLLTIVSDRIRHGRAELAFDAFPFPLGGRLRGRVTARRFAGQQEVSVTLRCVDERMATVRDSRGGSTDTVRPYQLYESRWRIPGAFGGRDVPLDLPLPVQPATELLRQPPLYWELEIAGHDPAGAVRFVVPVYAC